MKLLMLLSILDARVITGTAVPDGTGRQIWISNLGCTGTQNRLIDCTRNAFGSAPGCSHTRDVGVTCMQFVPGKTHSIYVDIVVNKHYFCCS